LVAFLSNHRTGHSSRSLIGRLFFGEIAHLPLFVFPFVKLLHNNDLVCFEVVATVLCGLWFLFVLPVLRELCGCVFPIFFCVGYGLAVV
jgi:hypothetical protein